jgi:endonuclease/exonuclease/phosphatase (EEP) superfamily protein YafD
VNLHASTTDNALRDTLRALAGPWGGPLLFGGDLNIKHPELRGLVHLGGNHVDHLFSDGRPATRVEVLERGTLSDHAPVRVTL